MGERARPLLAKGALLYKLVDRFRIVSLWLQLGDPSLLLLLGLGQQGALDLLWFCF